MEGTISLMEAILKELLKKICHMETDSFIGQMELNIQVSGKMDTNKA